MKFKSVNERVRVTPGSIRVLAIQNEELFVRVAKAIREKVVVEFPEMSAASDLEIAEAICADVISGEYIQDNLINLEKKMLDW